MKNVKVALILITLMVAFSAISMANDQTSTNNQSNNTSNTNTNQNNINLNINLGDTMTDIRSEFVFMVGVTSPVLGSTQTKYFGEEGYTTHLSGLNWGLGFTKRNYFGKGLPSTGGAGYFEYGTVALIVPFIGLGYDYRYDETLVIGIGLPDLLHIGFTF